MEGILDVDSLEMGLWVDRWLVELRTNGANSRDLRRVAQQLARDDENDRGKETRVEFMDFVTQQRRGR